MTKTPQQIRNEVEKEEKVEIYLDEDFFDKKRQDYSEEEWEKIVGKWILLNAYVEAKLFKQGKISKIIFHRFSRGGYRIFNVNRTDLMGSNEFNSLFDIKPIDIKLFRNAVKEVISKLND